MQFQGTFVFDAEIAGIDSYLVRTIPKVEDFTECCSQSSRLSRHRICSNLRVHMKHFFHHKRNGIFPRLQQIAFHHSQQRPAQRTVYHRATHQGIYVRCTIISCSRHCACKPPNEFWGASSCICLPDFRSCCWPHFSRDEANIQPPRLLPESITCIGI